VVVLTFRAVTFQFKTQEEVDVIVRLSKPSPFLSWAPPFKETKTEVEEWIEFQYDPVHHYGNAHSLVGPN
jgi:hypothetical protein